MDILTTVLTVIEALVKFTPVIIQAGTDLKPFAQALYRQLSGGAAMTDAQRAELDASIDALFARLEEPLPAPQPGDPDYKSPA